MMLGREISGWQERALKAEVECERLGDELRKRACEAHSYLSQLQDSYQATMEHAARICEERANKMRDSPASFMLSTRAAASDTCAFYIRKAAKGEGRAA
jgi:hypothetical protein